MTSVYPDDLMLLNEQITKRIIDQTLLQVRIATNPHLKPEDAEKFVGELVAKRRSIWGVEENTATLDKAGLDSLKKMLKNSPSSVKVK